MLSNALGRSLALATGAMLVFAGSAGAVTRSLDITTAPGVAALAAVGAPAPAQPMRIGIALRRPNPAGEQALEAALYDPASPKYHHFLTPAQFAQRFGVDQRDVNATRAWLARNGLHVAFASQTGDYLVADGTVAAVERLTGVRELRYGAGARSFVANDRPAQVPDDLPILSILGLDSRAQHRPLEQAAGPVPDTGERTPQDLWSVYQQPPENVGHGVSVGIIGSGSPDDLEEYVHGFDDQNGLPPVPVQIVKTPANGDYSYTGAEGEWKLDVAAVSGMAPGIDREVLYASPTYADTDLMGSLTAWANDPHGPLIMNMSYGECEPTPANSAFTAVPTIDGNEHPTETLPQLGLGNSSHPAEDHALSQAVIEGRTLFASTGDNGAGCGAFYAPSPVGSGNGIVEQFDGLTEDPASNVNTVAVGGTVLYTDGGNPPQRSLEYTWTHSGGNASPFITAPDYQQNVPNLTRTCVSDESGQPTNTGQVCRGVPDVAALSGDIAGNGYAGSGGTSLSAPLWAGMWARVIASTPGATGYGFANPAIYRIGKDAARYAKAFNDITVGSNGNPTLPGWDYASGWGTPNVSSLIQALKETAQPRPGGGAGGGASGGTGGTGGGTSGGSACTDRIAPTATFKRAKRKGKTLTLSGRARDRGCEVHGSGILKSVQVAVARQSGKKCRFLSAKGRAGRATSCARPRFLKARGTGAWTLKIRAGKGRYVVLVRATDLAGNRGKVRRVKVRVR
jgi:subtilase family serine protease